MSEKSKVLDLTDECLVCYNDKLTDGNRTVEGEVFVRFQDEHGNFYEGSRVIKVRVKKCKT